MLPYLPPPACVCVCVFGHSCRGDKVLTAAPGLWGKDRWRVDWRRTADTAGIAPDQSLDNLTSYDMTSGGSANLSARHPILENYRSNNNYFFIFLYWSVNAHSPNIMFCHSSIHRIADSPGLNIYLFFFCGENNTHYVIAYTTNLAKRVQIIFHSKIKRLE